MQIFPEISTAESGGVGGRPPPREDEGVRGEPSLRPDACRFPRGSGRRGLGHGAERGTSSRRSPSGAVHLPRALGWPSLCPESPVTRVRSVPATAGAGRARRTLSRVLGSRSTSAQPCEGPWGSRLRSGVLEKGAAMRVGAREGRGRRTEGEGSPGSVRGASAARFAGHAGWGQARAFSEQGGPLPRPHQTFAPGQAALSLAWLRLWGG